MIRRFSLLLSLPSLLISVACTSTPAEPPGRWAEYTGRYALTPDFIFNVTEDGALLTLLPTFWGSLQVLDPVRPDRFVSLLHREIVFTFVRDSNGAVAALEVEGHRDLAGTAVRLADGERLPVERLLAGEVDSAIAALRHGAGEIDAERALALGRRMITRLNTTVATGIEFLRAIAPDLSPSADLEDLLASGAMITGDRVAARLAFGETLRLAPDNAFAAAAIRYLDEDPEPTGGWTLPFSLDALFAPPTKEEIAAVAADWAGADLSAREVEVVAERTAELHGTPYRVRILAHTVHGVRHLGATIQPVRPLPGCCAVVMELHGVGWDYPDVPIEQSEVAEILRDAMANTLIAIPAFRGTALTLGGERFLAGGPPTDAWAGAADDGIAFLNAVLAREPLADEGRICVAGKSRGGTVALLIAERDRRVRCAVDWTGPADWFEQQERYGWTLREQVRLALDSRWKPGMGWGSAGQFIEQNLEPTLETGSPELAAVRHRMLAASPRYFVDLLPRVQLHYGIEDAIVPRKNGDTLVEALRARSDGAPPFEAHFHPHAGHDLPYPKAYDQTRAFLMSVIGGQ